ncbi:MAG: MOSC domain-containing protein [Myxococcota bacterium]
MVGSTAEEYGPRGDAARHLALPALEEGLRSLSAPTDRGRVVRIVARRADGVRETPARVLLSPEEGVPGDRWRRATPERPEVQLAVMRADVAELIANGQPITHAGDNLFVELDLSTANLPPGSRLRVGAAVVEVTPEPHDGCHKFRGRFGADALRFVSMKSLRALNLRGIYWMVIEAGEVGVGDPIEVLCRLAP